MKEGSDEVERTTQGVKEEHKPELDSATIDELMKRYQRPENITGPGRILEQLTKRVYGQTRKLDIVPEAQKPIGAPAS